MYWAFNASPDDVAAVGVAECRKTVAAFGNWHLAVRVAAARHIIVSVLKSTASLAPDTLQA